MKREERSGFAFYLQILILLMVFLGVCTILLQAFAGAAVQSRNARKKNDAVELCRSAAEAFAADGTLDGTLSLLDAGGTAKAGAAQLRYNENLQPDENGCYTLTLTVQTEAAGRGALVRAYFSVTDENGEECAALETEKYEQNKTEGGSADAA